MARIIVVDDDQMVRMAVRRILEPKGHQVEEAMDGVEGLELHRSNPADLLFVDIFMPNKSGLEVIQELNSSDSTAKIIAMSSIGMQDELDMMSLAKRYGAHRAFQKPFEINEVLEAVDEMLGTESGGEGKEKTE